jgi:transcriptional regulator of acetoin/glycerol metabolism
MPRRRLRRKTQKAQRHAQTLPASSSVSQITRGAPDVERLAYTPRQAAEALGVSRSTFYRRVLRPSM